MKRKLTDNGVEELTEAQLRDELIGRRFPTGTFTIKPHESWLTCDAILSPPLPDDLAHPMYAYYAALGGMGLTIEELFEIAHSSSDDGPMFGEGGIELHRPLYVGETFTIQGGIQDVVRKSGRSGTFDIISFKLDLIDQEGKVAAVSTNSFIFPRRR